MVSGSHHDFFYLLVTLRAALAAAFHGERAVTQQDSCQ